MRIEDDAAGAGRRRPTAAAAESDGDNEAEEPREKVIVRSDGTVTYVGKDMAYQLWKFGLLGKDFHYRVFADAGEGAAVVDDIHGRRGRASAPPFGGASWVCNVIDTRQSYLQKLLKQALAALGYEKQARHSVHYSYEMVALSHATARELGYEIDADAGSAVRRSVRTQGPGREGRRPARSVDRESRRRSLQAQSRAAGRPDPADRGRRSPSPPCATSW